MKSNANEKKCSVCFLKTDKKLTENKEKELKKLVDNFVREYLQIAKG